MMSQKGPTLLLPPDLIAPDYDARCITGVAGSVRRALGLSASRALPSELLPAGPFACVILIIVDALGCNQVAAHRGTLPAMDRVLDRGRLETITSVLPSTTTAALTSLLSGLTPQEHGMLGYTLYLREYAMLADMLRFNPAWLPGRGGLVDSPDTPRRLFPVPTLFETLEAEGVTTRALIHQDYIGSALSEIQLAGATRVGIVTAADLCVTLRRLVGDGPRPLFVSAYWHAIDALGHSCGPGSPEAAAELNSFFAVLEGEFLERIPAERRRETLVLLTADHGQVDANPAQELRMDDHPDIWELLLMPPAGDRRATYLYARQGEAEALRQALAPFADRFHVLRSKDALDAGLFGRGAPLPETELRIGDLLVLGREGATVVGPERKKPAHPLRGRHGGASPAEMEVPLLVLPLAD